LLAVTLPYPLSDAYLLTPEKFKIYPSVDFFLKSTTQLFDQVCMI
jgi:hypothetical protein